MSDVSHGLHTHVLLMLALGAVFGVLFLLYYPMGLDIGEYARRSGKDEKLLHTTVFFKGFRKEIGRARVASV